MINRKPVFARRDFLRDGMAALRKSFLLAATLFCLTPIQFGPWIANICAQSPPDAGTSTSELETEEAESNKRIPAEKEPPDLSASLLPSLKLTPLTDRGGIWIDAQQKSVVVQGVIVLREGFLELFACPEGTKEHESIVAVKCKSFEVHTALLAVGLEPGKPVRFRPDYEAATGPVVNVRVVWESKDGKQKVARAQEWIRHAKQGTEMEHEWVFAGSRFWTDEQTGEEYYYADGGELICLSNFSTAMLDLPIQSSQENTGLMFDAFTSRIPAIGTKVYVVLDGSETKPKK